jgi:hypothetical protein
MGAAQVLSRLRAAGFQLHADGDRLTVAPASLLRDDDRDIIKAHKAGLLALLTAAQALPGPAEVPLLPADSRPYSLSKVAGDAAMPSPGTMALSPDFRPARGISAASDSLRRTPTTWPSGCTCATCTPTIGTCALSVGTTGRTAAATIARRH